MRLFSRGSKPPEERTHPAPRAVGSPSAKLGLGRRIRSSKTLEDVHIDLLQVLESYGPRQYPELPRLVPSGWAWSGSATQKPTVVVSGTMQDGYPGFVSLRPTPEGTEAGIYDLAGEMTLPLVGHWKQRDRSLTSIGQVDAALAITAPPVPDDYVDELIERLGLTANQDNWAKAAAELHQMFVLKAITFMEKEPQSVKNAFIADHSNAPLGVDGLRLILESLRRWNERVIPYAQDIPPRVRALILEAGALNEL
jgi:hypothetical protein